MIIVINISIEELYENFNKIINNLSDPIKIINKNSETAILLPEQLYNDINDTIYYQTVPELINEKSQDN